MKKKEKMNNQKPNLFDHATSELSQDAFIAWLLSWGNEQAKTYNEPLHRCGQAFAARLLQPAVEVAPEEINEVVVRKQMHNIDLWVEVNEKYLLVIEDKVHSGRHSDQLSRYREIAEDWCAKEGFQPCFVYFKTGAEPRISLQAAETKGYHLFLREDFLAFLRSFSHVEHDVFQDFLAYLEKMEKSFRAFVETPLENWNNPEWVGFLQALEKSGVVQSWYPVSNPRGGFWGSYIADTPLGKAKAYLQTEGDLLCFKVDAGEQSQEKTALQQLREESHHAVMQLALEHETISDSLQRPTRFGLGKTMTVAVVPKEEWMKVSQGIIDLPQTIAKLEAYRGLLQQLPKE